MTNVAVLADRRAEKAGVVKTPKFSISACTLNDIDDCTQMGKTMHCESAYANIPFSEAAVIVMLRHVIKDTKHKALVVRDMEGTLIGMALMYQSPYYFAEHEFAVYDRCIYVDPAWRGSSVFLRLFSLLLSWAKDSGASEFIIGTTTKVNTEQFEDVLLRLGMDRVGGVYKLTL